jgi:hypothetical protein
VIQLAFGWGRQRRRTACGIGFVAPAVTNGGAFSCPAALMPAPAAGKAGGSAPG